MPTQLHRLGRTSGLLFSALALSLTLSACDATSAPKAASAGPAATAEAPTLRAEDLQGRWELHNQFSAGGSGGTQIKVCDKDCSAADANKVSEQRFQLEIGIRDGKIVGCQLSDDTGPNDSATCRLADASLQIEVGRTANKVLYEIQKAADGSFSGDTFMKAPAFPGGRMKIGHASLNRPVKS